MGMVRIDDAKACAVPQAAAFGAEQCLLGTGWTGDEMVIVGGCRTCGNRGVYLAPGGDRPAAHGFDGA
jgi:hypothetical protein